jgi:hypothetical protein
MSHAKGRLNKFLVVLAISVIIVVAPPELAQSSTITTPPEIKEVGLFNLLSQSPQPQPSGSPNLITAPSPSPSPVSTSNGYKDILDFLRDSIWQSIGALLAIIAIILTVIIYFLQKSKKALSYEILSETALLSVSKKVKDRIEILFEGEAVREVHLILIQISNTGNIPILPSDFLNNIKLSFNDDAKILSAEISDKNPQFTDAAISVVSQKELMVSPSLWNGGDTITVKLLVSEFNGDVKLSGRIIGIQDIRLNNIGRNTSTIFTVLFGMVSMLAGFALTAFTKQSAFSILVVIGYVLLAIPVFYDKKYRKFVFEVARAVYLR